MHEQPTPEPQGGEPSRKTQILWEEEEDLGRVTKKLPVVDAGSAGDQEQEIKAEVGKDPELLRLGEEQEKILGEFNEHRDGNSQDWQLYDKFNRDIDWLLGEKNRIAAKRQSHDRLSEAEERLYAIADKQIDVADSIRKGTFCSELLQRLGVIDREIKARQNESN
ncbi:hypothetical protein KJ903_01730 [Patescibacteria group bacterium]|nr:hypothetical protein [Patescibacteria group bacterium]